MRRAAGIVQDITERKAAMDEVLAGRARLEAALASMSDAVFISDNEGRFTHFNEAFATFHRYPDKEACARTLAEYPAFLDVFFPNGELAPLDQWAVPRALRGEVVTNAEYTLHRKDTGDRWVGSYNFAPIRNAEGQIMGSVVVGRDVTERKRLEAERETALAKYRTLFECFPLGITVADREGQIVETNRLAEEILALPGGELRTRKLGGAEWQIFRADGAPMPPEEYPSLRALREQALVANVEMRVLTPRSESKWLSVTAAPLPFDGYGVVVTYADITANKRDQQALQSSEERRALALDAARAGTWEWELATGRNVWSDELWGLYGLPLRSCEPSYAAWRRTVHPDDVNRLEKALQEVVRDGGELALEWRVSEPSGGTRWLMSRGRPHRDEGGQVVRYAGVVIDITDRKQAEVRLRESEARAQAMLRAIPDMIFRLDRKGVFLDYKADIKDLHEQARSVVGRRNRDISPPAFASLIERKIEATLAAGQMQTFEYKLSVPEAGELDFEARMAPSGPDEVIAIVRNITERRRVEAELLRTRNTLLEAQRIARLGSFEYIAATQTTVWSEEEYRIYGLDPAKPSPTYEVMLAKCIHPDDEALLHQTFMKAVERLTVYELEHRIVRPDGSVRWVHDRAQPYLDSQGRLVRYVGTTLDITERKQAEERLQESESRLRLAIQAANIGLWDWDLLSNAVYYSPEWKRQLGYGEEEIAHNFQEWQDRVHPQDLDTALRRIQAFLAKPVGRHEVELRMRHKDGSYRWIYSAADVLRDPTGRPVRMLGCHLDVTERKRAMEVLRRQAERLQWLYGLSRAMVQAGGTVEGTVMVAMRHLIAMLKCQPAIVGVFDREDGQAELYVANGEGETIIRNVPLPPKEALAEWEGLRQARVEIVEDTNSPVGPQRLAHMLRAQGLRSYVGAPLATHQRVAGALLVGWPEPRAIPAEEAEIAGEVAGQMTVALEQIRLLQEATQHAQTLERRVVERTAQLEAVNRELEAFSYSVSHDLRAPLRHVHGYVDLLAREAGEGLTEKARRYLATISAASREMATLIDDLLAFSRLGKTEMHEAALDLPPLVAEVSRSLEQAHPGRRISWRVSPLPRVYGDPALLRQVLINLLGNAVKYSGPRDPAEIEVGCAGMEAERAVLFVRDNGVGFDPAYAHKLFRVFQRLHRADEFEGTGIGLAIVQRVVARHGGRTWAEGALGSGATFYFTLATTPPASAAGAVAEQETSI